MWLQPCKSALFPALMWPTNSNESLMVVTGVPKRRCHCSRFGTSATSGHASRRPASGPTGGNDKTAQRCAAPTPKHSNWYPPPESTDAHAHALTHYTRNRRLLHAFDSMSLAFCPAYSAERSVGTVDSCFAVGVTPVPSVLIPPPEEGKGGTMVCGSAYRSIREAHYSLPYCCWDAFFSIGHCLCQNHVYVAWPGGQSSRRTTPLLVYY